MANEQAQETNATEHENLVQLAQQLERGCSPDELRGLCFRLGIEPDNLPATTKSELARELVQHCGRRGRLPELETAFGQLQAGRREWLAEYRRRLLQETEFVELRGIPLPVDRDGRRRDPRVPLDRVYIHLQAVAEAEQRRQEEAEARRLEEKMAADDEVAAGERAGPAPDFLGGVRTLGEYLYRQGQVYQAAERPPPVDPQAALAEHRRLVVLGAPGAGKSTMLRTLARRAAEDEQGPVPVLASLRDFAAAYAQDRQLSLHDFALLVRQVVAIALGQIGDAAAVPHLIFALGDSNSFVRRSVTEALGQIGDAAAVPHLISALDDGDSTMRQSAAKALGQISDAAAVPYLITALDDSDSHVRLSAVQALGQIPPRIGDRLLLQQVRRALRRRLADTGDTQHGRTVAEVAFEALEQVAARLAVLEVAALDLEDPLLRVDSKQ